MYELLYTSLASEEVTDDEVLNILETARKHNEINDITGMLIYTRKEFGSVGKELLI